MQDVDFGEVDEIRVCGLFCFDWIENNGYILLLLYDRTLC